MKIVIISDIHLHRWPYGDPEARLANTVQALRSALMHATKIEADLVAITGDIFHTPGRISTPVMEATYRTFRSFKNLRYVFVPGNHDETHRGQESNALCFLEQFGPVATCSDPVIDLGVSYLPTIRALPYIEDEAEIQRFLEASPNGSLVLMHQGVKHVEMNAKGFVLNEGIDPAWVPETIFGLFTGHYHSMRRFAKSGTIPGALVQHNFGDVDDPRGFLVVEGERDPQITQVESDAYRFFDVAYEDSIAYTLDRALEVAEGNFLRIKDVPPKLIPELQSLVVEKKAWAADPMILPASEVREINDVKIDMENSLSKLLDLFIESRNIPEDSAKVGRDILGSL